MKKKVLFGLYVTSTFVGDDDSHLPPASDSSIFLYCASYDDKKLTHYCNVLNEADYIHSLLRPILTIRNSYEVKEINIL